MTDMEPENPGPLLKYMRSRNADRIEALTDALDNLLQAITAEDQFHDRSLTITGSTANLRWLLEAEDDARATLKGGTP